MDDFIVLSRSGGIGTITLNRPTDGVFWSHSIAVQLALALSAIEFDDNLQATVLTVAGPPSRLKRILESHRTENRKVVAHGEWDKLYETMCRLKKPCVAAINSVAAGSAFQVALLCDVRISHSRAMMGRPGWVSGLNGLFGAIVEQDQLTKIAANGHILSGNLIPAKTCLELGLINQIVPEDDLITEASILAQNLATAPPRILGLPKRRLWELSSCGFRERLELSKRIYRDAFMSAKSTKPLTRLLAARPIRTP